jgi:membrane-bound lytic murein transglycosylase D
MLIIRKIDPQLSARIILLLAITLQFSACSTSSVPSENREIDVMLEHEIGDLDQELADKIMAEPRSLKSKSRAVVEDEIHRRVWWWMRYYTVRDRERFERNLNRGENYLPLVQQILREYKLPQELFYLALIESGFVTHAKSTANAVGIWQFMRPTALNYGLDVDHVLDERRHPIEATHAAAKYLLFLHKKFQSWYLAIAAYNAGQGRISNAVKRGKTRDFWSLAERGYLPAETIDYIPKFLAAATIGEHLENFKFDQIKTKREWPEIASIELKLKKRSKLNIKEIARKTTLTETELLRFNPQLKQALNHPRLKKIRVWVPKDAAERYLSLTTAQNDEKPSKTKRKQI